MERNWKEQESAEAFQWTKKWDKNMLGQKCSRSKMGWVKNVPIKNCQFKIDRVKNGRIKNDFIPLV